MVLLKTIFLIALVVLFPLGEILRFDFGNGVAITAFDIAVAAASLVYIIVSLKKAFKNDYLVKSFVVFFVVCTLSLAVNMPVLGIAKASIAALYIVRYSAYFLIYLIVKSFDKSFQKKIYWIAIVSGLFILLEGFLQYFLYPSLRNLYYLGWDEHLYRMFSSFLDPNFLGAFLVLYFLFVLGLLIKKNNRGQMKILLTIIACTTLIAIRLTYSRDAYLMLLVGVIIFFMRTEYKKLLGGLLLISCAIVVVASVFLYKPIEGTNLFRVTSIYARVGSSITAWNIFLKNPILGVGYDAYRYAQERYGYLQGNTWQQGHSGAGTDNSFLLVLATTGVIGLAVYLYFWFFVFKYIWSKREKPMAIVAFSSIISLFVNSLFLNSLFYPFIIGWIWLIIGLL